MGVEHDDRRSPLTQDVLKHTGLVNDILRQLTLDSSRSDSLTILND